jgi:hypothetical protein
MRRALATLVIALGCTAIGPSALAVPPSPVSAVEGLAGQTGARAISYVGVIADRVNLRSAGVGAAGWWFPQFDAGEPVDGRPTGEGVRAALPAWVTPFNHTIGPDDPGCSQDEIADGCLPTYAFRTFSQDGPARSAGGDPSWSPLRLPSGEMGRSGAIVDPKTNGSDNNTINRIQLTGDVPPTFYVAVLIDNTGNAHDPSELEVRGNAGMVDSPTGGAQVEPTFPTPIDLSANAVPDLHVFRVDGFASGDYLKLRLHGNGVAAAFGGVLFDVVDPFSRR